MHFHDTFLHLLVLCAWLAFAQPHQGHDKEVWTIQSKSHLRVEGKTNINSFQCTVPQYGRIDTMVLTHATGGRVEVLGALVVPIVKFDCRHKVMTKDLQKTLKADTHPLLTVHFLSFSKKLSALAHSGTLWGHVDIRLAGAVKRFNMAYEVKRTAQGHYELLGEQRVLFSDFKLKPPSKLGGTIKVEDELLVVFQLQLKRLH